MARRFFSGPAGKAAKSILATRMAERRVQMAQNRLKAQRARHDTRDWVVNRRERTRKLIELGGLVTKAGLVDLTDDDRAVIYGLLLAAAGQLRNEQRERALLLWGRRGRRSFATEVNGDQ